MYAHIDHALKRAYSLSEIHVVLINLALAGFVTLSHGGALLVAFSKELPEIADIRAIAMFSLPLCALAIASAGAGLVHRGWMKPVLVFHSGLVVLSAVWLVLWSLELLLVGIADEQFVWMVGFFTAWVTYAAVLAVRFLLGNSPSAYYVPAFTMLLAAAIDLGVLSRAF